MRDSVVLAVAAALATAVALIAHLSGGVSGQDASELSWTIEYGGIGSINDISARSSQSFYAVGASLAHFDGVTWKVFDRAEDTSIYTAVDFYDSDDGWAVGDGFAVQFSGGAWRTPVSLPGVSLRDVVLIGPASGWAVGWDRTREGPAILELAGGEWQQAEIGGQSGTKRLESVWMASSSEGWAVSTETALHYEDGAWTAATKSPGGHSVTGLAEDDVWVVGGPQYSPFVPGSALIYHYDGDQWTLAVDVPEGGLVDVALQAGDGYAVGYEGVVLRFDGERWRSLGRLIDGSRFYQVTCVEFVPGTEHAIVGMNDGRVYGLKNGRAEVLWDKTRFTGLALSSRDLGWAVSGSEALVFDGQSWSPANSGSPLNRARGIAAVGDSEAWAVGSGGLILHFEGESWQLVPSPVSVTLDKVRMISGQLGWAVGWDTFGTQASPDMRSVVLEYDGESWQPIWDKRSTDFLPVFDVDGTSREDVWLAASQGMWHYDGSSWSLQPIEDTCRTIAVASDEEGWAGCIDAIYHFDGISWKEALTTASKMYYDRLLMESNGSVWSSTLTGYLLHQSGGEWRFVAKLPMALGPLAVSASGEDSRLWVAAQPRTVLSGDREWLASRTPVAAPTTGRTAVPFTPIAMATDTPTPDASPNASGTPGASCRAYLPRVAHLP